MTSRPSSASARSASCSWASLLSAYGLAGASAIVFAHAAGRTARRPSPSRARATRQATPARRSASSRWCVARTLPASGRAVSAQRLADVRRRRRSGRPRDGRSSRIGGAHGARGRAGRPAASGERRPVGASGDDAVQCHDRHATRGQVLDQMAAGEAGGAGDERPGRSLASRSSVLRLVVGAERRVLLLDRPPPPLVAAVPVDGVAQRRRRTAPAAPSRAPRSFVGVEAVAAVVARAVGDRLDQRRRLAELAEDAVRQLDVRAPRCRRRCCRPRR